jgi:hypothetical protein
MDGIKHQTPNTKHQQNPESKQTMAKKQSRPASQGVYPRGPEMLVF